MHFDLVDRVLETGGDRIVTLKQVSAAEEYLQDHFPGFPVLPGVMMIEALVQAARRLAETRPEGQNARLVLGGVRAVKYGSFLRPGDALRCEVTLSKAPGDGTLEFKGEGTVLRPGGGETPTAVSGRFTLRPITPPGAG
jgi:3-hydroxyacyl-[acyl-carrier-protein] dehydratase